MFYQLRELENACKRAAVLKPHGDITFDDFALQSLTSHTQPTKQEPTKLALENAMRDQQGVIAKVARQFGLSRQALYRRLQKFEIDY
ncbi:MAG: helix-turn-helix domain-containing protein [Pseudoalteromonas prydzensis]|uniref:helix-turn-helix domain-containing protein n=1 Tax=Pseudoalteromonas prydzensis TaxID=182141 RepID=UPI003F97A473